MYGRIYSRCSSPSQCTSPHPSSSKSVSERRTDSQLSAQRQAVFSTVPAFCCSPIVQVLLRDSCDENLINFNKLSWRKKNKTNKRKQRGLPAAARAARQWAAKHCGSSVIRITLQDESGSVRTHTNTHTHKKIRTVCLHDFSNCIMSTQEISPN